MHSIGREVRVLNEKQVKLALGAMLHDVGKIMYRYNDGRNHSSSGYDFLKEQGIEDKEILNQVLFHHTHMIKDANLDSDSLAYITYWADNVAAGSDRKEKADSIERGYDKFMPLQSIFNILNGNNQNYSYPMASIYDDGSIVYPNDSIKQYSEEIYGKVVSRIKEGLRAIELTKEYINSLLGVLEANLSFVPSSTDKSQIGDISLYDHLKVTAAISSCILAYMEEKEIVDYREKLYLNARNSYEDEAFLLLSMDMSGIQDFIYKVDTDGALKTLRSKSFYLEILLEHIVDNILETLELSRVNLIYSGGGHAYMLLPNTENAKRNICDLDKELKTWFIDNFGTDLYMAIGYAPCSANELMNKPQGSYKEIFRRVSRNVSQRKNSRYTAEEIKIINNKKSKQFERECRVCGNLDNVNERGLCTMCSSLMSLSSHILNDPFITILKDSELEGDKVKLPFDCVMVMETEESLKKRIKQDDSFVRSYSKNRMFTGFNVSTRLWVGDYNNGSTFGELVDAAQGIKRLGILRADVDNLGQAFVQGFDKCGDGGEYVSISRSATFSRKLSIFFKLHINYILGNGRFSVEGKDLRCPTRRAIIIYSGGDDLFIAGPWNEILEAAVDINSALREYTQETLSISAGLSLVPGKYPVTAMAKQGGELEDCSKNSEGKNAITLFDETGRYKWDTLEKDVIGEKYNLINEYFTINKDKGSSALYKLMGYIRSSSEKINLARFAYMLGRMEPDKDADENVKEIYHKFSSEMYKWMTAGSEERRQLLTAIYLYVYLHRNNKEE